MPARRPATRMLAPFGVAQIRDQPVTELRQFGPRRVVPAHLEQQHFEQPKVILASERQQDDAAGTDSFDRFAYRVRELLVAALRPKGAKQRLSTAPRELTRGSLLKRACSGRPVPAA